MVGKRATGEYHVVFFKSVVGGGRWCWILYKRQGRGEVCLASGMGYESREDAVRGWREFREGVGSATF
jgi:hypothetical protein